MGRLMLGLAILCFGLSALILGLAARLPVRDHPASSVRVTPPESALQPIANEGNVEGRAPVANRMPAAAHGAAVADAQRVGLLAGDLFPPGQAMLPGRGRAMVWNIAAQLIPLAPGAIVAVEGHTDDRPVRSDALGSYRSNDELSRGRARAVADLLAAAGIAESVLLIRGWGAARPVDSNETEAGRARNRRVEVILIPATGQ